jgi:putative membrane protein
MQRHRTKWLISASFLLIALLVLSGLRPYDMATWALEVAPVVIAIPILWATYTRFPLTTLLYVCIFAHAVVLLIGGPL